MHRLKSWIILFVTAIAVITGISTWSYYNRDNNRDKDTEDLSQSTDALHIWYGDEALTTALTNAAAAYYEETGVTVIPELHNEAGYLENIYEVSVKNDDIPLPDMYLLANDSLGKAYTSGLTEEIDKESLNIGGGFPETALNAVRCNDSYRGYPLYFETTVLLYNKTYMEGACISAAEREDAQAVGDVHELADENEDEDVSIAPLTYEEAVAAGYNLDNMLPSSITGILEFADNYDAPPGVEAVFKWDVNDIFYNYYFPGSYMNLGGPSGDDPGIIDIDNEKVRSCMELYQDLNQFFSIDTDDVSYHKVLGEFIEGKVVMTVVTSDAIGTIEQAKRDGEFEYDYGTTMIPEITEEMNSRSLSVTTSLVINGFSDKKAACGDFAKWVIETRTDSLYEESGKIPSIRGGGLPYEGLKAFVDEYEYSISMPKLLGASNFWVQLEICCSKIWEGEDVADLLNRLQQQMEREIVP